MDQFTVGDLDQILQGGYVISYNISLKSLINYLNFFS